MSNDAHKKVFKASIKAEFVLDRLARVKRKFNKCCINAIEIFLAPVDFLDYFSHQGQNENEKSFSQLIAHLFRRPQLALILCSLVFP